MKIRFLISIGLSLTIALVGLRWSAADTKAPIRITDEEFNYGQLPPNTAVAHVHWIVNTTSSNITIDTVVTGCGCATAPLTQKEIAPKDSVPVIVTFSSKNFIGSVAKRPYVKLTGSDEKYGFKFYADVVTTPDELKPLAVFPPVMDFTVTAPEQSLTRKFSMANRADDVVAIRSVSTPSYIEEIGLPDTLRPGEIFEGIMTVKESYRDSSFIGAVTFEVNNSPLYRLTAPVLKKLDHRADDTLMVKDSTMKSGK